MGDTNGCVTKSAVARLSMVGAVPGLPPPNMPGQLGNIPTMGDQKTLLSNMQGSYGNMPMTGGSYVHPPSTHGPTERLPTVSDTTAPTMGKFPNCPCIGGGAICPSGSTGLFVDIMFT
jgi:hypothetical protein